MQKAYIETSSINRALNASVDGRKLASVLEHLGFFSTVGMHTIYELARTFLNQAHFERGKQLFCILRDLDASFVPPTRKLIDQEMLKLRTGAAVIPFLDHDNQVATKLEITKLAEGYFDKQAENFIKIRENEIQVISPLLSNEYLNHIKRVKKKKPATFHKLKTFEDVLAHFAGDFPRIIREILQNRVSYSEAFELSHRLDSFPALRASVRANLYYSAIHILHLTMPGGDKIDDYRHLIDSSYSENIITADLQVRNTSKSINPDLNVLWWDDINI